jgi:hypothetical protein
MVASLCAIEEEFRGVLAGVWVSHRIGALQFPVLSLQGLNNGEEDERTAKLVAVMLAHIDVPVVGVVQQNELWGLALAALCGRRSGGQPLLQLMNGLLSQRRSHELDARWVEGSVNDQVRHDFPSLAKAKE